MKIIIGGDFVPTESNKHFFNVGNIDEIVDKKIQQKLNMADFRIFNLEVPLTNSEKPINKCGPNLIAGEETINGIIKFCPDLLGLANNHILDQGADGLFRTQEILTQNKIAFVGAGKDMEAAQKPYYFTLKGKTIGIYACAESEFTIAGLNSPGANPYNPLISYEHIKEMQASCDYIIVLYHGGKEYYRYPSPKLQKLCRKFAEAGADLIICQHSHCVGCRERYNRSEIVYGQGNFIFDRCSDEYWNSGLLIELHIEEKTGVWKTEYIPIEKKDGKYFLSDTPDIMQGFTERSQMIMKDGFIEQSYSRYCIDNIKPYLQIFHGYNFLQQIMFKFNIHLKFPFYYSKRDLLAIRNCIECEAHQELILEAIKQITNTNKR